MTEPPPPHPYPLTRPNPTTTHSPTHPPYLPHPTYHWQETVAGVLISLLPPQAPANFRKWFPFNKVRDPGGFHKGTRQAARVFLQQVCYC